MEPIPFNVELTITAIAVVIGYTLIVYFRSKDVRRLQRQSAEDITTVITDYQFVNDYFRALIQDSVIMGFYMSIVASILVFYLFAVVPPLLEMEVPISLYAALGSMPHTFLVTLLVATPMFIFTTFVRDRRLKRLGRYQARPGLLVSRKYSLVKELYVDRNGIEGRIGLPWSQVRSLQRLDNHQIEIWYKRSPVLLSRLLRADYLVLHCTEVSDADTIVASWERYAR
jgi:hypothetical protein